MALRSGHGTGAGVPRVEVLPPDELPDGLPAEARPVSPGDRGDGGRFAPGNGLARVGGRARAGSTRLSRRLGLQELPDGAAFAPYRASAVAFRRAQCAALELAWSRYLSDRAAEEGDAEMALASSRLADASRQNLLAAHELCAREAKARPTNPGGTWPGYETADDESEEPAR